MNRIRIVSSLLLLGFLVSTLPLVEGSPTKNPSLTDSRLRSAFLIRAGIAEYASIVESSEKNTQHAINQQLQQHFDAVLEILSANEKESLQVALSRLEKRQGISWNYGQRAHFHRYLSQQRANNVARLAGYRDRGLFPLNEGHAKQPVPIFVDDHDTACAVGHLMRCAGWAPEVELIAATRLLVFVPDVGRGPLANWILQSGLTHEEAAIIQPGYAPPSWQVSMSTLLSPGYQLDVDAYWYDGTTVQISPSALRYENFSFSTSIFQPGPIPNPDYFGVRTDFNRLFDPVYNNGYSPNWPHANLLTLTSLSASGGDMTFWMSFDIVSLDPSLAIDRAGIWFPNGFNEPFGEVTAQTPIPFFSSEVFDPPLTATTTYTSENQDSAIFEPRSRVTMHTQISLEWGSFTDAFTHTVRLVPIPEPASLPLALLAITCFAGSRKRVSRTTLT